MANNKGDRVISEWRSRESVVIKKGNNGYWTETFQYDFVG